jgi:hypothetical protein
MRWRTRRELFNDFRRHMQSLPNVILHVGELAYGDRPFEVTDKTQDPNDVQLRTNDILWSKENVLSLVIRTFPPGWKYGSWVDGDFCFTRRDVALETIQMLQVHAWCQMFSQYADLSGGATGNAHRIERVNNSFAYNYIQNGYQLPAGFANGGWKKTGAEIYYDSVVAGKPTGVGATGGAWAFRRDAFDAVGGMIDKCACGHSDWFSCFGLVGEDAPDMHIGGYTKDYLDYIRAWQNNAKSIRKNIGYVSGFCTHFFHGPKSLRSYSTRDLILVKHKFAPTFDLVPDWQGVYQIRPDRVGLRDAFRKYFMERNEDATS